MNDEDQILVTVSENSAKIADLCEELQSVTDDAVSVIMGLMFVLSSALADSTMESEKAGRILQAHIDMLRCECQDDMAGVIKGLGSSLKRDLH